MITLDATTKTLELVLGAAIATTQPDYTTAFADQTTTTFTPGASDGTGNSTTNVTIVAAPAASTQRQVKFVSVTNKDTAAITVSINYNNNGTRRLIYKASLAIGYTLTYTSGDGWRVWTTAGALLTSADTSGLPIRYFLQGSLNNTQIKALASGGSAAYQTIVPQPAVGQVIVADWAVLNLLVPSGAYTGVDAGTQQGISVAYGDWDTDCLNFMPWTGVAFTVQLLPFHFPDAANANYPDDALFVVGVKPLKIIAWNSVDFGGGGVNNALHWAIQYRLYDYVNSVFV